MLDVIFLIVACALIILSLLQGGKSDGINAAFTGGDGLNLFANVKERGAEKVLARITFVFGFAFLILAILIVYVRK